MSAFTFSTSQIAIAQGYAAAGNYPGMYRYLSGVVSAGGGDPRLSSWLSTAAAINEGTGFYADFVRGAMYEAGRDNGVPIDAAAFQAASDSLAGAVLTSLVRNEALGIDVVIRVDVATAVREFNLPMDSWAGTVGAAFPLGVGGLGLDPQTSDFYVALDAYYLEHGYVPIELAGRFFELVDDNLAGVAEGLSDPATRQDILSDLNDLIGEAFDPTEWSDLLDRLGDVASGLATGVGSIWNRWFDPLYHEIFDPIQEYIDDFIDSLKDVFNNAEALSSPLILDLDGDGVETISINAGANFDHDGNGFAEATGWVGDDDGLLVFDRNGNGRIDNGSELFGNSTFLVGGSPAVNGFEALADFDSNNDGRVDAADVAFSSLRVWKDANRNGVTDAGELLTLSQAGVASISTTYLDTAFIDEHRNYHLQSGSFTRTNGTSGGVSDVWFQVDYADTDPVGINESIQTTPEIEALPDVVGIGNVVSLHDAMALDSTGVLQGLVEQFIASGDVASRRTIVDQILLIWTGAGQYNQGSRGPHIEDGRMLYVLEAFLGESYHQGGWGANPGPQAASLIAEGYETLASYVYGQLMFQSHLSTMVGQIGVSFSGGVASWNAAAVVASLHASYVVNPAATLTMMGELWVSLYSLGSSSAVLLAELQSYGDLDGDQFEVALATIDKLPMYGTQGNDTLIAWRPEDTALFGGAGNDVVRGNAGNDYLDGGAGNDSLMGGSGSDTYMYRPGDGYDVINNQDASSNRTDVLLFGEGIAPGSVTARRQGHSLVLTFGSLPGQVTISNYFIDDAAGGHQIDQIRFHDGTVWDVAAVKPMVQVASDNSDELHGYSGSEVLGGLGGDDSIFGHDGDDTLNGGAGNDTLDGGRGSDTYMFSIGDGSDVINNNDSGVGSDQILLGTGIDPTTVTPLRRGDSLVLSFANGTDKITVANYFAGDAMGNYAVDEIRFHDGTVWNVAMVKSLVQIASSGDDELHGYATNDQLVGLAGNDVIRGYAGNDQLDGGLGNDRLEGGEGSDTLNDGGGSDIVNGGDGDDAIYLAADADTDVVNGGKGNDVYHVGSGSGIDRIEGFDQVGAGSDEVVVDAFTRAMLLNYDTNGYDVTLHFGDPATGAIVKSIVLAGFLSIESVSHSIRFSDGVVLQPQDFRRAYWSGTGSADTYTGGFAPDQITGGGGDDILSGGFGPDTIYGNDGNDLIEGGAGADRLYDGTGADIVNGGEGDDHIYAEFQWGDDQYRGGAGNDTYYYTAYETLAHDYFISSEIFEGEGEGVDTVITNYYNFSLNSTEVENLIVENTGYQWYTYNYQSVISRQIAGNELDNVIQVRGNPMAGAHLIIDGGLGNDTMIGSNASETYVVDSENDVVIEDAAYTSIDTVRSSISYSLADKPSIENIELVGVGTFALGNSGDNRLNGSMAVGANTLVGGLGNDTYVIDGEDIVVELAGEGVDTIEVRSFAAGGPKTYYVDPGGSNIEIFKLHADAGASGIVGNDEDNVLIGNNGANYLFGGAGNDELRSGGSAYQVSDTLDGGAGDDVLIGGSGTAVYMTGGTGDDEIRIGAEWSTTISFNRGDGHDVILANSTIPYGTASVNFGADIDSSNVLWIRDGDDLLIQFGDIATDSLRVVGYWTQEAGVEGVSGLVDDFSFWNEPGTRSGATVEALANRAPRSMAPPGWGAVVPVGQSFSYTIPEDVFSDEDVGSLAYAIDNLPSWLSYDASTRTIHGTPPAGEQNASIQLTATDGFGASGSAYFYITVMNVVQGTAGNDTLTGTSGSDMLIGLQGNDSLNGGLGADRMLGGLGNDTYAVDTQGDVVVEEVDEGDDLVNVSTSYYSLSDHVERLTFTSSAGQSSGYGNELNNTMTGNSSSNSLYGNGGNDTLLGNNGNDYLFGGDGDDALNGGSGSDEMYGGWGNDRYVVDANDYIEEYEGEGTDLVETAATYTLGENFENLTLTGTSGVSGNGNSLDNVITGNSGANTLRGYDGSDYLDGGSGNDTMIGGAGDDTYVVGVAGDVVTELAGEGVDTVISSVTYTLSTHLENLTLSGTSAINGTGNAAGNILIGNSGANALSGLGGDDVLEGRGGTDTLTGGAGNDGYLMARGYGSDTVVENDATSGNLDVARFLSGVTYDQLWFRRPSSSNNLEITIIGTSDKLIIKDWYLGNQYRIEEIRTSDDGMLLTMTNVQALVSAMSGMTMPAQGQTTLTTAQRNQLAATFASTWQSQPSAQRIMTTLPASTADEDVPGAPVRFTSSGGYLSETLLESRSPSELCGGMVWAELDNIDLWPGRSDVQTKPLIVGRDPIVVGHDIPTKPLSLDVGEDLRILIEAMAGFNGFGSECADVHHATAPLDVRIAIPLI